MIKVPATPAGLDALEELVAAGVTVNVTLVFSSRQYRLARDAVWRGAQRRKNARRLQERLQHLCFAAWTFTPRRPCRSLSPAAQGMVGILNAKRIWAENQQYWAQQPTPLAAGDHLRQHGHEETERSALEVRRGLRRQRHPDQSAGHQRGGRRERPHLHPAGRSTCRPPPWSRRSTGWWTWRSSKRR